MLSSFSALLLATMTMAQPASADPNTIVVTGIRAQDYRDRLAACLARNCPPNEDIDATLALAEALFVEGEYGDARSAIRASLARNRRHTRDFPEPVSDLYRANARVAHHLGRDREAEISTYQILAALRTGLPVEDHRHFTARLEIAQSMTAAGRSETAQRELRRLMEVARAGGREDVAQMAELRALWLNYSAAPYGPTKNRLLDLSRSTDPQQRILASGARAMLVRIYSAEGDEDRANAIIADMARDGDRPRQLLFSPPYRLVQQHDPEDTRRTGNALAEQGLYVANTAERLTDTYDDKWIDVGFWVQPDGQVAELQILRRGRGSGGWEDPLLESIQGRRYSPGDRSTYRLERYTYSATLHYTATGTHISDRSPRARIEYLDLSQGASPPPAPGSRPDTD